MAAVFTVTQGYRQRVRAVASAAQLWPSLAGLARRVQQFIEPLFGDPAFFPSHFPNRFTGLICLFHQRRGSLITELWSECRSHGKRLLDVSPGSLAIGFKPVD